MPRRVLLVCWGSRGDVAPLVGLGRAMQAAGDEVSLLAARDFGGLVRSAGLGFVPFDIDLRATADSAQGRAWLGGHRTVFGEGRAMRHVLDRFADPLIEGLWGLTGDADLLVSGVLTADSCLSLAAARGQQHATALLAPLLPSRQGASSASAVWPARRSIVNTALSTGILASAYPLLSVPGAEIRRRLGVRRTGARWFLRQVAATPTVLGTSRYVVPPPLDLPQVRVTGYWPSYGGDPEPPAETAQHLAAGLGAARERGQPVVYLGFGSMTTRDAAGTARLLVSAALAAGVHPVIHAGWSGLDTHLERREDVTVVGHVPHPWLFSRCDAVVHHGGAGTTGAAVQAGVPQVVVAHMGDQPYWAGRLHRLGVAAAPLRRTGLRAEELARAIAGVTTAPAAAPRRRSARALALAVATEDGPAAAIAALA